MSPAFLGRSRPWRWLAAMAPFLALGASAQVQQGNQSVNPAEYAVGAQGANYRVWQSAVPSFTNKQGRVVYRTNSYTELATGLNHLVNGQWVPSSENIQITQGGGVATNGQHQVGFAANINTSNAVEIITPDGKDLRSHIMGMSYYDSATGSNVLFAELQDSTGQLVANNQVVYPNAFTDCDADVRYTYTRAGCEQDIVVRRQLPAPESYGLNPDATWLQVWTEFYDPPAPAIELIPDGTDELLDFGVMKMERGKAFIIGNETNAVPVSKVWTTVQGRTFLVEEVQFDAVAAQLQSLPAASGGGSANGTGYQPIRGFPSRLPPVPTLARRAGDTLKLAESRPPEKGLVLDYAVKNGSLTNLTFQGDTTYLISGALSLYLTTTIEGGTVIKFTNQSVSPSLAIHGPLNCQTGPYRMAVLTGMDDDTVGEKITGSSGNPGGAYAVYGFDDEYTGGPVTLQYVRISYASFGCFFDTSATNWLRHCQFVNDGTAVQVFGGVLNSQNLLINNASGSAFYGINSTNKAINVTIDNAGKVFNNGFGAALNLTNSLLVAISGAGSSYGGSYNFTNSSSSVFQTAGAGSHYLADGSPYRNAGTANIDPTLLTDLQNLTTYPPLILSNTFAANTTLYPQAQRDYDTPDIGYHYAPIDWLGSCTVTDATLTLTNGVALGQESYGMITLLNGSQLVSQGSPLQRNYIAYYSLVQEQATNLSGHTPDYAGQYPLYPLYTNHTVPPNIFLRFTTLCPPNVGGYTFLMLTDTNYYLISRFTMMDCEVYGGNDYWDMTPGSSTVINFQNNLFQYPQITVGDGGGVTAYNNLFTGSSGFVEFDNATFQNNAFDMCSNGTYLPAGTLGFNAYLNFDTNNAYSPILTNDKVVTNFTWVTGPLGAYYQATNSVLLNQGSTNANLLGLYHYTATTNELPETTNIVTIGYHYVALDGGLPLDTSGNGPDYLLDSNGNGVVDSGEISWTNAGDLGLQVIITQPPNNSILP